MATNTTPQDKVQIEFSKEPELKGLLAKLQPGDEVDVKSAKLQLDQQDDNTATLSILEIEFAQPDGSAAGGDDADEDQPGLKVVKGGGDDEDAEGAEEGVTDATAPAPKS